MRRVVATVAPKKRGLKQAGKNLIAEIGRSRDRCPEEEGTETSATPATTTTIARVATVAPKKRGLKPKEAADMDEEIAVSRPLPRRRGD